MIISILKDLKKQFKPYYLVTLAKKKPYKGFKQVKCYEYNDVVNYQLGKNYITSEYITFERFVYYWLLKQK